MNCIENGIEQGDASVMTHYLENNPIIRTLPSETVLQFTVRPSTHSGRTAKQLIFKAAWSVRGEPVEP